MDGGEYGCVQVAMDTGKVATSAPKRVSDDPDVSISGISSIISDLQTIFVHESATAYFALSVYLSVYTNLTVTE